MGKLINGTWQPSGILERSDNDEGRFQRESAGFRGWLGSEDFPMEPDRYLLYVSHACPWSHRTTIFRKLKELEDQIPLRAVQPHMGDNGWEFADSGDPETDAQYLYELYQRADNGYSGAVTVPVLWDRTKQTIVSNESADIIRMFNAISDTSRDYYPESRQSDIDAINDTIYHKVNNGVYKAGFATSQQAYDKAVTELFDTLDMLESRLMTQRYLIDNAITEADWRLFVTLIRFDAVYEHHFNCNICRIADYPYLSDYLAHLYQLPSIEETVHMDEIKTHYYTSHPEINPLGIIPAGPAITPDILSAIKG